MKSETISVIVPVYQAENTIEACVESILGQSYRELELILVDDGSTDKSAEIIDIYAEREERVISFHQKNQGVSAARNRGLSLACGEYIMFVDSDDRIKCDCCEKLLNVLKKYECDIAVSGIDDTLRNMVGEDKELFLDRAGLKERFEELYLSWAFHSACGKLYRRDWAKRCSFPVDIKLGEDLLFNLAYFSEDVKAVFTGYRGYVYVWNAESATKRFRETDFEVQKLLYRRSCEFYCHVLGNRGTSEAAAHVFLCNILDIYTNLTLTGTKRECLAFLKKYLKDPLLIWLCRKSSPQTLQRKLLRLGVLKNRPYLILAVGEVKKIKLRMKAI